MWGYFIAGAVVVGLLWMAWELRRAPLECWFCGKLYDDPKYDACPYCKFKP